MHVAYIHQHFSTMHGASGTRSYEMSKRLMRAGHRVTMICGAYAYGGVTSDRHRRVTEHDVDGIRVLCVAEPYGNEMGFTRRLMAFGRFARTATRVVSKLDADLVFATSTPLTVGIPGMKGAKRLRVPFVFEVRDLWPELVIAMGMLRNPLLVAYARRLERKIYRAAQRVIALAPGIKEGIQTKLLRVLESGECLAVGETKPYKVDVRIIAATNTDLNQQIAAGDFRQDLYFRLNIVPLEIPALNQRTEDIETLAKHFLSQCASKYTVKAPKFSKRTFKVLHNYPWPGNIRELRNLCERLSILLPGKIIEPENLPPEFSNGTKTQHDTAFVLPELGIELDSLEANMIHQALSRTQGNRSKSARLLGISRDTLLYRIQKHGIATH